MPEYSGSYNTEIDIESTYLVSYAHWSWENPCWKKHFSSFGKFQPILPRLFFRLFFKNYILDPDQISWEENGDLKVISGSWPLKYCHKYHREWCEYCKVAGRRSFQTHSTNDCTFLRRDSQSSSMGTWVWRADQHTLMSMRISTTIKLLAMQMLLQ